jgi:Zn-dependent peptidase ImmA (M78 family)/transcriptional regulator with XRE-family HTH domain
VGNESSLLQSTAVPGKVVPVTADVVAWAIHDAGFDEAAVAKTLKVPTSTVRAWTKGNELPLTGQFRQLAKLLNRPPSFFLQSEPPPTPTTAPRFRRHAASGDREPLRPEEARALRTARLLKAVVRSLRDGRDDFDLPAFPTFLPTRGPASAAAEFRKYTRWKVTEQQQAKTPSRAFSLLRDRLEEFGFLVMLLPLRREGCRGFAFFDDIAPLVAVNSAQTFEARTFTLMHEIGHVVLKEDGFDETYDADTKREQWCERFAAAFLLPEAAVEQFVSTTLGGEVRDLSDARRAASRFRVSLTATCIRLEELNLAPRGGLVRLIPHNDYLKPDDEGGFNPDPTTAGKRLREYGPAVVGEIMLAEDAGQLRRHDVQRYLRVTDEKYADLAGRLSDAVTGNLAVMDEDE